MARSTAAAHPDVVFTRFDESSAALLNLRTKRYYSLNETAARVWELLAEGRDHAAVAATLVAEFQVELDQAESCVSDLLDAARRRGPAGGMRAVGRWSGAAVRTGRVA